MTGAAPHAAVIFGTFAFAYFFSALLRAVTATLAPVFSAELGLQAADLGLLAGAYFFGFAALQLPLGRALDRFGPRRTSMVLLAVAVLGCAAFALAASLPGLIAARVLIGAGMAAGLMAPLTAYRRVFSQAAQLRANSWMLMTGSLGMVASTVPVQMLLPTLGWRGLFWAVAVMLLLAVVLIAVLLPRDPPPGLGTATAASTPAATALEPTPPPQLLTPGEGLLLGAQAKRAAATQSGSYSAIVRHPLFVRLAPLGFFLYGGLVAVQSLWAGPWLTRVSGWTATQAAQGLFSINLAMLAAFGTWGAVMPHLARRGITPLRLMRWGVPLPLLMLLVIVVLGDRSSATHWALWCVSCTFVSVSQPAVGAAFPAAQAGRALSAFNLVIFGGVFCIQWGIGLLIDALRAGGIDEISSFQIAFGVFGLCCVASYAWFLRGADNPD
ncbi:MAG TPA: MFS transporter [Rubrivivax sp.]|nr:MFS transporter [Rubrivivax sp.]